MAKVETRFMACPLLARCFGACTTARLPSSRISGVGFAKPLSNLERLFLTSHLRMRRTEMIFSLSHGTCGGSDPQPLAPL